MIGMNRSPVRQGDVGRRVQRQIRPARVQVTRARQDDVVGKHPDPFSGMNRAIHDHMFNPRVDRQRSRQIQQMAPVELDRLVRGGVCGQVDGGKTSRVHHLMLIRVPIQAAIDHQVSPGIDAQGDDLVGLGDMNVEHSDENGRRDRQHLPVLQLAQRQPGRVIEAGEGRTVSATGVEPVLEPRGNVHRSILVGVRPLRWAVQSVGQAILGKGSS